MIREAGLEDMIDSNIEVEENYKIKKVVGFGATSTVYKAFYYENEKYNISSQNETISKKTVAIKKIKDI